MVDTGRMASTTAGTARGAEISIRGLDKVFGTMKAVDDVSIEIPSGEFLALLPSPEGATAMLD